MTSFPSKGRRRKGERSRLVAEGDAQFGHGAHGKEHDCQEGDAKVIARVGGVMPLPR